MKAEMAVLRFFSLHMFWLSESLNDVECIEYMGLTEGEAVGSPHFVIILNKKWPQFLQRRL